MRTAFSVTPATLADCRAVAKLHVASWQAAYRDLLPADYLAKLSVEQREQMWRGTVTSGHPRLWVARPEVDLAAPLGFISVGAARDEDAPAATAEIWAMYVAPTAWRRGVGRVLWQTALRWVKAQRFARVSLWVIAANQPAIDFYRAIGFAPEAASVKTFELGGVTLEEIRMSQAVTS